MDKSEISMTEELAESEFEQWVEDNEFDVDESKIDEETQKMFNTMKRKIVRAFMRGRLVRNDDGKLVYTVSKFSEEKYAGNEISCSAPIGRAFMRRAAAKGGVGAASFELMSSVTGKDTGYLANLAAQDMSVLMAITYFFTNV